MLISAIAAFFRHKVVHSIFIVACVRPFEQIQMSRDISKHGFAATFVCDHNVLGNTHKHGLQGVLYFKHPNDELVEKIQSEHFSNRYTWLIVGDKVPEKLSYVRYDAEITFLYIRTTDNDTSVLSSEMNLYPFQDIYVHPEKGSTLHPWAYWSPNKGLHVDFERERVLRRLDFKGYPLRIAAPLGQYSDTWYNGTYSEYVVDETLTELDAGIRCGYATSSLVIEKLNGTKVVKTVELWGTTINNSSMILKLLYGDCELGGGVLRVLTTRIKVIDYIIPIWPFSVGFTYLAERGSSSNMFVKPFAASVWWSFLAIGLVLALALWVTGSSQEEKDGSFCAVLATFLQQDAAAVPKGVSGRWTFAVVSICAMLVHAYYTSAIVSALMNTGSSGPDSLASLADSKYAIASEDYTYMRYLFFDVETTWNDLEYLKRKKKTSNFYQVLERGVELVQDGNTAFHTEYNQIYPHFKTFSDDQICKLQHVDTVPEVMSWITGTPKGQYTNSFRAAGTWLHEVGLAKRLVTRLQALRPPCRAQLLAERVKFGDIASLLGLVAFGALLSLVILGLENIFARKVRRVTNEQSFVIRSVDMLERDDVDA